MQRDFLPFTINDSNHCLLLLAINLYGKTKIKEIMKDLNQLIEDIDIKGLKLFIKVNINVKQYKNMEIE